MISLHSKADEKVIISGAGLAGSLLALYLAKRGLKVELYERRPDMRLGDAGGGRSINLALSARGIHALAEVGAAEQVLASAIPMKGRQIHPLSGSQSFVPYGRDDTQVINSISRSGLNIALLNLAEEDPNVTLRFNQRCLGMDLEAGEIRLRDETSGRTYTEKSQTVFGTDGVASPLRMELLPTARFDFSQQYLEHSYKELTIPADERGGFRMEKHALHIWPRGGFMMIALPNPDGSFTCTLFYAHSGVNSFENLTSEESVLRFFQQNFPDAVEMMPDLRRDFFLNPTGTLITIKCAPWHFRDRMLLIGDSAHAIVPFYGQGMNCAFEDCSVLGQCIDEHGTNWERVFADYEIRRKENTDAIADLALDNFVEMRDTSGDPKFAMKKNLEHRLEELYPGRFISKYAMVTFHRLPYLTAMKKGRIQDEILMDACRNAKSVDDIDAGKLMSLIEVTFASNGIV
jgi:kynurenine 3-monooxygenase